MFRRLSVAIVCCVAVACTKSTTVSTDAPSPTPAGDYKPQVTAWSLRSIGSDGRTISIVYTMSGVASDCERKGTTTADESADKVVVSAHKLMRQERGRACTEELAYVDAVVVLNSPLGSRALVGCRPPRTDESEDGICRDLSRTRDVPTPQPTG